MIKVRVQITRPLTKDTYAYWQCPSKRCIHYHHVLVGIYPEKLNINTKCPVCRSQYHIKYLGNISGSPIITANLLEPVKEPSTSGKQYKEEAPDEVIEEDKGDKR